MSIITDAVIVTLFEDKQGIGDVNRYLHEVDEIRHQQFHLIDNSSAGGTKYPSMTVYQACFNHMLDTDIEDAFFGAAWTDRWHPVLIMDSEISGYQILKYSKEGIRKGTLFKYERSLW